MPTQQFETTQAALRDAISAVAPIVERRNTIPILGSFLIENGYIRATNLDIEVRASFGMSGKIKKPFAVECGQIARITPHIEADETITISEGDGMASIGFNGSKYGVIQYQGSDFPDFDFGDFGEGDSTGNAGILAAIKRILFAVSNEETRYYLNGVCFSTFQGVPCVVSTNGHMAAIAEIPFLPTNADKQIVPIGLLKYLVSRRTEPDRISFIAEPKGRIKVDFPGLQVKGKLIDGTYPDYSRIVPKNATPRMTFDRARLLTILKRMAAFANTGLYGGRAVKLKFKDDGTVALTLRHPSSGDANESFAACGVDEKSYGYEVAFNAQYLIKILSAFTADTVSLAQDDASSPALFTAENDGLRVVAMPMRA